MVRTSPATITNMPMRNCITRSFMTVLAFSVPALGRAHLGYGGAIVAELGHFAEPFAGLTADELADPRVGVGLQALRRAVVDDLRLTLAQPGQRVEHHDPV